MYLPFEKLSAESRVWIYTGSRALTEAELKLVAEMLHSFCEQWNAHGQALQTSFTIEKNQFIVMALDENFESPSGCSIDSSVAFIQNLEAKYQIDLLDKMNVAFKQGEFITYKTLLDFKKLAKEKAVSENTIVFNNLVNTIQEWNESWEVPAAESWHSRFF